MEKSTSVDFGIKLLDIRPKIIYFFFRTIEKKTDLLYNNIEEAGCRSTEEQNGIG